MRGRRRRPPLLHAGLALGLLVAAGLPLPARAVQTEELSLEPWPPAVQGRRRTGFFFALAPGSVGRDSLVVGNRSSAPMRVRLQIQDARFSDGGIEYGLPGALGGAGRWIRLAASALSLPPGESRVVDLTVVRPGSSRGPGPWLGAVVAWAEPPEGAGVQVVGRLALLVKVVDSSAREAPVSVGEVRLRIEGGALPRRAVVLAKVGNNTDSPARAEIGGRILGLMAGGERELPRQALELGPAEVREVSLPWRPGLAGLVRGEVDAASGEARVAATSAPELVVPWLALLAALALALPLGLWLRLAGRLGPLGKLSRAPRRL